VPYILFGISAILLAYASRQEIQEVEEMVLMIKIIGVCPECKKNTVEKLQGNHYVCRGCGAVMYPRFKWHIVQKGGGK
jgi:ribosomal protein L37AE/L43A